MTPASRAREIAAHLTKRCDCPTNTVDERIACYDARRALEADAPESMLLLADLMTAQILLDVRQVA